MGWAEVPGATDQDQKDARTAVEIVRFIMNVYGSVGLIALNDRLTEEQIELMNRIREEEEMATLKDEDPSPVTFRKQSDVTITDPSGWIMNESVKVILLDEEVDDVTISYKNGDYVTFRRKED
jgi:transcription antitermination factor NusG